MGVSARPCVFYGIKIEGYDAKLVDAIERMYEDNEECIGAFDGMCGEYMVLGQRLFNGGESRYSFEEGDEFVSLDPNMLNFFEAIYKTEFLEKLPEYAYLIDKPFQLHMLLHWH